MSDTFNWLHLSDLHFGLSGQSPYLGEIKARFLDDLAELHKTSGPWHAVFFTGDLVQSGEAAQFVGLKAAFLDAFWARLRELGSGNAAFYAVPGNHDLQRPVQKSNGAAPGKPKPPATALTLINQFESVSEDFWAASAGEYHEMLTGAFKGYTEWWATAPGRPRALAHPVGFLPGDFAHTQAVAGRRIGILGLNSTALQLTGDNFLGKLAVHPVQAMRLVSDLPQWAAAHDACILLTHQGPAWLSETAQGDYAEINPAGRFAVHLFGHEHASVFFGQSWGGGTTRLVAQGHSLFSKEPIQLPQAEERRHGYSAGRITFGGGQGTIRFWPRKAWKDKVNGWRFGRDLESVAKLEESDGGTPPSLITVSGPRSQKQDEIPHGTHDPKAARIAEIYQRVLRQLTEALEKNPAMVAYLFNAFEAGKVEEKENAASWLTLYIVENFERALRAVLGKSDCGSGGDVDQFFRLMLPLSVAWEKTATVGPVGPGEQATPFPAKATPLAAQLVRDLVAGKSFDEKRGSTKFVPSAAIEGPFGSEKLAGMKDELRAKVRAELFETLRHTLDLSDEDLADALRTRWELAPDPYFLILAESQRELLQLLGKDAVLRHLMVFQRSPEAAPLLKIKEGSLATMVDIFLLKLKQAQTAPASAKK